MAATPETPFWKPGSATTPELRKFGLLFVVLSGLLAGWLAWDRGLEAATVPAAIAAGLLLVSLVVPKVLFPAWWPWMVLVNVLGFVNSHLLLAVVFYLLFTPIGLIMRLLGKDPLGDRDFAAAKRAAAAGDSLWHRRDTPQLAPEHFERQF